MENILNKALSEVLTPLYSEELRDAFDTGYKFTPEFENTMRELIRKTDRPVTRYIGYMAAAAVAVIAIGSAIIVPSIINSGIEVKPPEDTAESVTTSVTAPVVTTSQTTTSSTLNLNQGIPSVIDEDDAAVIDVATSDTSVSETYAPVTSDTTVITSDTTTSASSVTEDDIVATDEKDMDTEDDDAAVVDNDTDQEGTGEDEAVESAGDDDAVIIDEADSDEAVIISGTGDYNIDETFTVDVNNGDKLGDVMKKILPDFDFGSVWATSADYSPTGTLINANNQTEHLNFHRCEYSFIQDFVHSLGSAEANNEGFAVSEGIKKIKLYINDNQIVVRDYSDYGQNASAWRNYNEWFSSSEEDYEEDYEEDVLDDRGDEITAITGDLITITVSSTGKVEVQGSYVISDKTSHKNYLYQLSNERFDMDINAVKALFDKLEKAHISEDAQTVGDIIDGISLTADNISQAYIDVHNVYDTDLYHVKIDYDFVAGLLEAHRSDKARKVLSNQLSELEEPHGEVYVEFYTKDSAHITIYIDTGYITDQFVGYKFSTSWTDIENALDAVEKANNYTIPRFSTLGEYLADKNFTKLRWINVRGSKDGVEGTFTLYDEAELSTVIELLKAEFANTEYVEDTNNIHDFGRSLGINLRVEGYNILFRFFEKGYVKLHVGNSWINFRLSDGMTDRLEKTVRESPNAEFAPEETATEDWEQVVDDDAEEEVFNDEEEIDE